MSEHLLAMELGPVVQIIAAARKTRDHYFGSWMLSEIAKAAAHEAAVTCGTTGQEHDVLIAPAPTSIQQLADDQFAMGDEILVRVPSAVAPNDVATAARQAAHRRWLDFAKQASQEVEREEQRIGHSLVRDDIWSEQTLGGLGSDVAGEVVELYAAWVPLTADYSACLSQVKRLLFGRNGCRNFAQASGHPGIPKSSLDGRRESVITKAADERKPIQNRKLRLNRGEQLDVLGITKRVGDGKKNFPSTARLAAEPWIHGADQAKLPEFQTLVSECRKLAARKGKDDPILGSVAIDPSQFPNYPHYAPFPYEGAILFENRHHEFIHESADSEAEKEQVKEQLEKPKGELKAVIKRRGEPGSYYVALVADGDGVGKILQQCHAYDEHRQFSLRLSSFAGGVREIIDKHRGALIFAAGEDVNALLPLDTAIDCADALRKQFEAAINEGSHQTHATLSVGIAIGHFLDALEDTLAASRDMESLAKQGEKNALAIQYRSRGGAPIQFRTSWADAPDPLTEMNEWITLLNAGDLPDKVAYDIRNLAGFYDDWPTASDDETARRQRALRADLVRLLSRKRTEARRKVEPLMECVESPQDVIDLANKIIIAGVVLKAKRQARGGSE